MGELTPADPKMAAGMIRQTTPFFIHGVDKSKNMALDYLAVTHDPSPLALQTEELSDAGWFSEDELEQLEMFPFLRALAKHAFAAYRQ